MADDQRKPRALLPPLRPMVARSAPELPHSPGRTAYEPKFDGWRCLAFRTGDGHVHLQSRQQRSLNRYFPDVTAAIVEQLDGYLVLDGESTSTNPAPPPDNVILLRPPTTRQLRPFRASPAFCTSGWPRPTRGGEGP